MNNLFIPQFLGVLGLNLGVKKIRLLGKEIGKHCQSVAVIPTGQWDIYDITLVISGLTV